ncbi:MAG: ComF family protein [Clostridiales bacterium]|nr:ComF family protein [Clostridiales bacterium]
MGFFDKIKNFLAWLSFDEKWTCNICGKEIFSGEYICQKCKNNLPYNDGYICQHCGRQTPMPEEYCLTCKGNLTNIDVGRSAFVYKKPISILIKSLKYNKKAYLADVLAVHLSNLYFKNYFLADYLVYPPMTDKSLRKREYNHSKLLAEKLSERIGVPVIDVLVKTRETKRQATLNKEERLKNLKGAFRLKSRKIIKGKTILIVDDVTTTGTTAELIAEKLKKAGAIKVIVMTVASVPSKK